MPPPKKMSYFAQAIVCLAPDLKENAEALQAKRTAAGDTRSMVFEGVQIGELPEDYRGQESRLIILGHGTEKSTVICTSRGGANPRTAEVLARIVSVWLTPAGAGSPARIKRISLHMCLGGGNRGGTRGLHSLTNAFDVPPENSFACQFASHAGNLTIDVTARTDDAQMRVETKGTTDVFVNAQRMIGPIGDRHHAEGDKYVFVADPRSTPDKPLPPRGILASWKTESKISMLRGTIGGKAFESASVPSLAIRE
jgi:hypothetical protein